MMKHMMSIQIGNKLPARMQGFTLLELMVAMVVGVLIVGGAFSLHVGSRNTQTANEAQMDMVADARFAIELIAHDLRHAGMWGGTNKVSFIDCQSTMTACTSTAAGDTPPSPMTGDCTPGWYYDLSRPIFATDGTAGNPYPATCIPASEGYVNGTDVLEVKYADSNEPIALLGSQVYVRSNFINGRIFVGTVPPVLENYETSSLTGNHELNASVCYISDHTDSPGDGIPSLRRVSLVNSPALQTQTLISGVEDLQVQFGEDADDDGFIDRYVDPQDVTDWNLVYAAKIWLLLRTNEEMEGIDTTKTFNLAGVAKTVGGQDQHRYFVVSSVVNLRNMQQI